jgi:hypothetical protein
MQKIENPLVLNLSNETKALEHRDILQKNSNIFSREEEYAIPLLSQSKTILSKATTQIEIYPQKYPMSSAGSSLCFSPFG